MKRALFALTLLLAVVAGAGVGTVAAQENSTTSTPTPSDGTGETGPNQTVIRVGPHLSVTDYWYDGDEMHVKLYADLPTLVSVADVLGAVDESGARRVEAKRVMVRGETTVTMDVGEYRGAAAVSIGTSDGGVYLSTGIKPINPLAGGSATVGWLGGSALAIGCFILAALWVMRQEGGAPEVAGSDA
ncbi:MAG: hypothetical protein ABEJ68_07670 [Halobacteriaceae archaeon]